MRISAWIGFEQSQDTSSLRQTVLASGSASQASADSFYAVQLRLRRAQKHQVD